jgi:hypothetical protein
MERKQDRNRLSIYLQRVQQLERDAGYAIICEEDVLVVEGCIRNYNALYDDLKTLDASLVDRFSSLPDETSPGVVRLAARDLFVTLSDAMRTPPRDPFGLLCLIGPFWGGSGLRWA